MWGDIRSTSTEKSADIERWKRKLTPAVVAMGNLAKGREIFQRQCAACHRLFDEGGALGPDLTGSQRTNVAYLLENIIDPSAVVPEAHRMSVIQTTSGRTLTGVVLEEVSGIVKLQTEKELLSVPRDEIDSIEPTQLSLMPDGLLSDLSDEEIRDLVAYLGR